MSVKFNKGKCRVLHLGRSSLGHPDNAGGLENSSVDEDLGALGDKQLSTSLQYPLHGKESQEQPGLH